MGIPFNPFYLFRENFSLIVTRVRKAKIFCLMTSYYVLLREKEKEREREGEKEKE